MIQIEDKTQCCGCNACVQVCPTKCISMKHDTEGFQYPVVNVDDCINCGKCERVCPFLIPSDIRNPMKVYGMYNLDYNILKDSSSGGVFGSIAEYIISNGGVVYGAAFDNEFQVCHIGVDNIKDIEKLRHSKYVQSDIANSFIEVRRLLNDGRMVLFTGTPCQVLGLRKYLNRDYVGLYLVDIICHGVPSPKVWKTHLNEIRAKSQSKLEKVVFRDKKKGWAGYISYWFSEEHNNLLLDSSEDYYSLGFNKDLFLRPSCYNCKVRHFSSGSQLTIGDFWKIKITHPDKYNPMGVSVVTINDEKGYQLFNLLLDKFSHFESDIDKVLLGNPMIYSSPAEPRIRSEFFERLNQGQSFDSLILHYYLQNNNIICLGSYNLRAIVHQLHRFLKKGGLQHISNSSIISIMSQPVSKVQDIEIENEYRKLALEQDFYKKFVKQIDSMDTSSYVLIDLLEERFDLINFLGTIITKSEVFDELIPEIGPYKVIERASETTTALWKDNCVKYIELLRRKFLPERVILIKNYLAENMGNENKQQAFDNLLDIRKINLLLKEYYDFFISHYSGIKVIKLNSSELLFTDINSRYGCREWYYNNKAYSDIASQIYDYMLNVDDAVTTNMDGSR